MVPDIHRPAIFQVGPQALHNTKVSNQDDGIMVAVGSVELVRGHEQEQFIGDGEMTVYYDGSCPLCSAEIAHYRRMDISRRLVFMDVSKANGALGPELDRSTLMSRFHVRRSDGTLLSGAAAFVSIWRRLPRWRWVANAAALPGATFLLEMLYRLFLPVRPAISRLLRAVQ